MDFCAKPVQLMTTDLLVFFLALALLSVAQRSQGGGLCVRC